MSIADPRKGRKRRKGTLRANPVSCRYIYQEETRQLLLAMQEKHKKVGKALTD